MLVRCVLSMSVLFIVFVLFFVLGDTCDAFQGDLYASIANVVEGLG